MRVAISHRIGRGLARTHTDPRSSYLFAALIGAHPCPTDLRQVARRPLNVLAILDLPSPGRPDALNPQLRPETAQAIAPSVSQSPLLRIAQRGQASNDPGWRRKE